MKSGAILIPTCRRPEGLAKALAAIERLDVPARLTIFIGENDPEKKQGMGVAATVALAGYRFPIRVILVEQPGVVHVRNALLRAALEMPGVEFLTFLDDDERPEPQWIRAHLETQERTGADVVGGTVLPAFAVTPPVWAERISLYRQEEADGPIDMIWGVNNVLLTRSILERTQVWFDPQFSLTGGEDVEFFTRLKANGCQFAWSMDARVIEDVPAQRVSRGWLGRRAFRIGNTNAVTQLRWRYRRFGPLIILAKSLGRLAAALAMAFKNFGNQWQIVEAMCLAARSFGEIAALLGVRYRQYG